MNLQSQILAEVLRLQSIQNSFADQPAIVFGLSRGFESVIRETKSGLISEEVQTRCEDILDDIDRGKRSPHWSSIKDTLRSLKIDELVFEDVMRLCRLQDRFTDTIEKIVNEPGSGCAGLLPIKTPQHQWSGNLIYLEVVDSADEGSSTQVFYSPVIPRVGEVIVPDNGSHSVVTEVFYRAVCVDDYGLKKRNVMIPHVVVKPEEDDEEE